MDDDCLIVSEDIRSPPTKRPKVNPFMKTKQARLPFVRIPAKSSDAIPVEPQPTKTASAAGRRVSKKRKHSGSAQAVAEQPKSKKCNTVSSLSRKRRTSPEVEVSSSSDEVIMGSHEFPEDAPLNFCQKSSSATGKSPKSPLPSRTAAFLQKFVKKKPTQQDEVSTSVEETSDKHALQEGSDASDSHCKDEVIVQENGGCEVESEATKGQRSTQGINDKKKDDHNKESLCDESKDSSKASTQTERKCNSILEAIDSINKTKLSVYICSEDVDSAEKKLDSQSKKRKLSTDSGKSLRSEKENIARPPSPKKSKNLLTAFLQRGAKSSPESARAEGASSNGRNDENLVTSPESLKEDSSVASFEAREDVSNISGDKESRACSPKAKKSASDKTNDKSCCKGRTSSSNETDETLSEGESDDESASEGDDKSPSECDDKSPSECDDKSPSVADDKSASGADNKSPSEGDDKSVDVKSNATPAHASVRGCGRGAAQQKTARKSRNSETPKLASKKLTPKALAKLAEKKQREELRLMKQEEKMKQKLEKEEEKAKKEAERLKLKEEKKAELEKQRKEKEEQKKKKQEELDAKSKEREEKRKKIEDEKRAKEEEKKKAEEEEEERKKKVAQKFANFFKAGKEKPSGKTVAAKDSSGPFEQMQVSRYTAVAPIQRACLTEEARASLDELMTASSNDRPASGVRRSTYLDLLRAGDHKPLSSSATPPAVLVKVDKDDCVIIEQEADDEDEEDDDLEYTGEGMVVCEKGALDPKNHKGKLLKFCENRRPPYWGTWTKKPTVVRPRRPFAKEEIFDYEYDSDDDWEEEEENGESLSDSEGEKEDEEDEQYEVDNDFFVPHGYLSDDEGQEDEENIDGNDGAKDDAEHKEATGLVDNKEKLKAKQAEFEKELKKQTKQLKPRVLGCLWLHGDEESSGAAFNHLHRVMSGYSAVVCVPPPPDHVMPPSGEVPPTPDHVSTGETEVQADAAPTNKSLVEGMRSWYLTFPGIACVVPATSQPDLATPTAADADTPLVSTGANGSQKRKFFKTFPEEVRISKTKIKEKLIELASHRKCPDDGPYYNQNMWYVEVSVRERYGVTDAILPNDWSYCTSVPKTNRVKEDGTSVVESPAPSRATNLISKFTKVLSHEEKVILIANKNSDNPSTSRDSVVNDDVQEIKAGSVGCSSDTKTLGNAKKRPNNFKKSAKICAKKSSDKILTPDGRKTGKSSLKSTPVNSPLMAFFKTPRSSDSKKSNSKSPRVNVKQTTKDARPDNLCITID
ncbi:Chromatin assembly factor 1 subunit A [Trinorchestia longiramus]|nr:Chromatin assembly factor 1 subunit A [Trinorchestia longiramus]